MSPATATSPRVASFPQSIRHVHLPRGKLRHTGIVVSRSPRRIE
jgi:hypothetical protein